MHTFQVTNQQGELFTVREEKDWDGDCHRYSARIAPKGTPLYAGEFLVCCALSDTYDEELATALATRGLTRVK